MFRSRLTQPLLARSPYELETFVVLKGSPDYKFIHVEDYGYVVSYAPRMSGGDHHHLVWVRGESEMEVRLQLADSKVFVEDIYI